MSAWTNDWIAAAERAILLGDRLLGADDFAEACGRYLHAGAYYRLALRGAQVHSPEWRAWRDAQTAAFRAALPLLPYDATPLDDLGQGASGYLFCPRDRPAPWPAVVVACLEASGVAGISCGTAESMYEAVAVPVLEVGAACALVATTEGCTRLPAGRVQPETSDQLLQRAVRWIADQPRIDARRVSVAPGVTAARAALR